MDITLVFFRRCRRGAVNSLLGIQAHIVAHGVDLPYVYRSKAGLAGAAARHERIVIAGRDIQLPGCIHAQGAHVADDKSIDDAVGFHFLRRVIGVIGLDRLLPVYYQEAQDIPFFIFYRHVRRVRVGQLLQVGNSRFRAAAHLAGLDHRLLIGIHADAPGHQRHVSALDIGFLALGLGADAAFLVHNGVTDGIQQLFLRPGEFRVCIPFHHGLVGGVVPQISFRAVVGFAAGQRKHIRQLALALIAGKMGELVVDIDGIVVLRFGKGLVGLILQQILGYGIIGGAVRFREQALIGVVAIFELGKLIIDIPDVGRGLVLGVLHQLLVFRVSRQVFPGGGIICAVRLGELLQDAVLCRKPGKIRLHFGGIGLFAGSIRQQLIGLVILQVFRRDGIELSGTILSGELLPQRDFLSSALELGVLRFHPVRIGFCVPFQPGNIRAFIVLRTGDEARVDPVVYQVVLTHIVAVIRLGQRVKDTAVCCGQVHIPFPGDDGTDPHVAIGFFHIDILLGAHVESGRVRALAEGFIRRIGHDELFDCTNPFVLAGQVDRLAFDRNVCNVLGNAAFCRQGHVTRLAGGGYALAEQLLQHYIARQRLPSQHTAGHCNAHIATIGGDSA